MTAEERCTVCGEVILGATLSTCYVCGEEFHLNERNDVEGKDCGQVWIDEQYMALRFACQRCLDGEAPGPQMPRRKSKPRTGRRYRRRDR